MPSSPHPLITSSVCCLAFLNRERERGRESRRKLAPCLYSWSLKVCERERGKSDSRWRADWNPRSTPCMCASPPLYVCLSPLLSSSHHLLGLLFNFSGKRERVGGPSQLREVGAEKERNGKAGTRWRADWTPRSTPCMSRALARTA